MSSKRAVLLGAQEPRVTLAPRARSSQADDAAFLASSYGLTPDDWQYTVLDAWMGLRGDGRWSASRCGLSVPRQNGKNALLEVRELYGMVVLGEKFLHTAHEVKTARKAFLRIASFFENQRKYPELAALVREIRRTNGQEAVVLENGGLVEFIARSKGSGRGFTVDVLVLDEAQQLNEDALAALLPTISAAPSGNPQTIYTGTPPAPGMSGEVWTRVHDEGHERAVGRLSYHEWSVAGSVDCDDRELWAATNPALGTRLHMDVIEDERAQFDDEAFARERLGMWMSDQQLAVIPAAVWAARATAAPGVDGPVGYGVDMSPDRTVLAVGVAARAGDRVHVEVAQHGSCASGTRWVVDWLAARCGPPVVVDARSPAAALIPELKARGVNVIFTGAADMAAACGAFYDLATAEPLIPGGRFPFSHFDQPVLNMALAGAKKRGISGEGGWGWDRRDGTDITPLVAVTLAAFGLVAKSKKPKTGRAVFA